MTSTRHFIFLTALLLAGCTSVGTPDSLTHVLQRTDNQSATTQHFNYCHGGGCRISTPLSFTSTEWQSITAPFKKIKNAEAERQALIKAAQKFEEILGPKAHTTTDKPGTFSGGGASDQLDCHDEMLNTALFLHLLQQQKLLKFHQALGPAVRGHFIFGWPHTAMALQASKSQKVYILDTWELPTAQPPLLLPIAAWRD